MHVFSIGIDMKYKSTFRIWKIQSNTKAINNDVCMKQKNVFEPHKFNFTLKASLLDKYLTYIVVLYFFVFLFIFKGNRSIVSRIRKASAPVLFNFWLRT